MSWSIPSISTVLTASDCDPFFASVGQSFTSACIASLPKALLVAREERDDGSSGGHTHCELSAKSHQAQFGSPQSLPLCTSRKWDAAREFSRLSVNDQNAPHHTGCGVAGTRGSLFWTG